MSKKRSNKTYGFAQISNHLIIDKELSHSQYRQLSYIISLPDDWTINNKDVGRKIGIKDPHTIAKNWKVLLNGDYLRRTKETDDKGQFTGGYDYEISDYCYNPNAERVLNAEKPHLGKNHAHTNTDLSVLGKPNTDIKKEGCQLLRKLTHTDLILWFSNNGYTQTRDGDILAFSILKDGKMHVAVINTNPSYRFYQNEIGLAIEHICWHGLTKSELHTQIEQIKFDNEVKAKMQCLEVEPKIGLSTPELIRFNELSKRDELDLNESEAVEYKALQDSVKKTIENLYPEIFEPKMNFTNVRPKSSLEQIAAELKKIEGIDGKVEKNHVIIPIEKTTLAATNGKGEAIETIIGRVK